MEVYNMEKKFIEFVAEIMEVASSEISLETRYKEFAKWDSLMMLTLIMELEAEFGVIIPVEKIANVETLDDLFKLIC